MEPKRAMRQPQLPIYRVLRGSLCGIGITLVVIYLMVYAYFFLCWKIHYAARKNDVATVRLFLNTGIPPDFWNWQDRVPIWEACYAGSDEVANLLLKSGASPDICRNGARTGARNRK